MSYRFDVRSKSEFKQDIKRSHVLEAEIAIRLCIGLHSQSKKWPTLIPNGSDMSGEFIELDTKVTASPDFIINDNLVEITRSDVVCKYKFHQKKSKVERAITDKNDIVFVNGYGVDKQPMYIWLKSDELLDFTQRAITKYGEVLHPGAGKTGAINKTAYKYDIYWFEDLWKPLPVLIKTLPANYLKILQVTKV